MLNQNAEPSIGTAAWSDPTYYADKFQYREGSFWLGRVPGYEADCIGYSGNRHIFLCGETRSGKGRSFIINNLITWPGSIISIDPKGENATVAAARRANGNEFCEGMGQDTYVLDPFRTAKVDENLRGYFDPMMALRSDDPNLLDKANLLAAAICKPPEKNSGDSTVWLERGQKYLAAVILHVITSPVFEHQRRDLGLVRRMVLAGMHEEARILAADPDCKNVSGIEILLNDMLDNSACKGLISRRGARYLESYRNNPEYFDSVSTNAENETEFLDSPSIQEVIGSTGTLTRTFDPTTLKTSQQGVSVFLCLPQGEEEIYARWQRLMIYALSDAIVRTPGKPTRGDILISLDEFLSLSKMKRLEDGMEALAGAGGKLFIAVQKFGRLKALYGENWETFISGAGCQIWFAADEVEGSAQYLQKALGETEIIRIARNENSSENVVQTEATATTDGVTHTDGTSDQTGSSHSVNRSRSVQTGKSANHQSGISFQYGTQSGSSSGSSKEPHFIFAPLRSGTNSGTNRSRNSSQGSQSSDSYGTQTSRTRQYGTTDTTNTSHTVQQSTARNRSTTRTTSTARGETYGRGTTETFHKKPLLTVNEANRLLVAHEDRDIDDPRYPGFALIRIAGEDPFVVRKCFYDQDPVFAGKFSTHSDHRFIPPNRVPMLGYEATEDHFVTIRIEELMEGAPVKIELGPHIQPGLEVWPDEEPPVLYRLEAQDGEERLIHMPIAGKFVEGDEGLPVFRANQPFKKIEHDADSVPIDARVSLRLLDDIGQAMVANTFNADWITQVDDQQRELERLDQDLHTKRNQLDKLQTSAPMFSENLKALLGLVFVFSLIGFGIAAWLENPLPWLIGTGIGVWMGIGMWREEHSKHQGKISTARYEVQIAEKKPDADAVFHVSLSPGRNCR